MFLSSVACSMKKDGDGPGDGGGGSGRGGGSGGSAMVGDALTQRIGEINFCLLSTK